MDPQQVFSSYSPFVRIDERVRHCPICGKLLSRGPVGDRDRLHCAACGFIHYVNPSTGVAVLVVDGDRFVLCRRSKAASDSGKWNLPQGYIEFDEDWLTAAVREVKEETGLDVEIVSILSVVSNFFRPESHTLVIVPLARAVGGELRAGDDADEVRWYSSTEALPDLTTDADRHIIKRYFEAPFAGAPVDPRYATPPASTLD